MPSENKNRKRIRTPHILP